MSLSLFNKRNLDNKLLKIFDRWVNNQFDILGLILEKKLFIITCERLMGPI